MRRVKVYVEDQVRFDTAAGPWQRKSQRMRIQAQPTATNADQVYIGGTETPFAFREAHDDAHALYYNPVINRRAIIPFSALDRLTVKLERRAAQAASEADDAADDDSQE